MIVRRAVGSRPIDVRPSQRPTVDVSNPPLSPTFHAPVSRAAGTLWLVPTADLRRRASDTTDPALRNGIRAHKEGRHSEAIKQLVVVASSEDPLAGYAAYYAAISHFELGNTSEAERLLKGVRSKAPQGYLAEAAAISEGAIAESSALTDRGDLSDAN